MSSSAPAWTSVGIALTSLSLAIRHELILRRPVDIDVGVKQNPHADELELELWLTGRNRAVALRELRLYFEPPRAMFWRTRRVDQQPGPAFRFIKGESDDLIGQQPTCFVLRLEDYAEYFTRTRRGRRRFARYVAARTADGHRYVKRVPRAMRRAANERD